MPKKNTDYDKFKAAMKMLEGNGVIFKYDEGFVGINNDIKIDVYRDGDDDVPFMSVVFDSDGNFDHEA